MNSLATIPIDITQTLILSYLNVKETSIFGRVCKRFYSISQATDHWKYLFKQAWPLSYTLIEKEEISSIQNWKKFYENYYKQKKLYLDKPTFVNEHSMYDRCFLTSQRMTVLFQESSFRVNFRTLGNRNAFTHYVKTCFRILDPTSKTPQKLICLEEGHNLRRQDISEVHVKSNCIAVGTTAGAIKIFDHLGRSIHQLTEHTNYISVIRSKENILFSASWDKTIKVWNMTDKKSKANLKGHEGPVSCLELLGSDLLVSASSDTTFRIWDLHSMKLKETWQIHQAAINCLKIIKDQIVSGDQEGIICFTSIHDGICFKKFNTSIASPNKGIRDLYWDKNKLITLTLDDTVRIWDIDQKRCLNKLEKSRPDIILSQINCENNQLTILSSKAISVFDLKTYPQKEESEKQNWADWILQMFSSRSYTIN